MVGLRVRSLTVALGLAGLVASAAGGIPVASAAGSAAQLSQTPDATWQTNGIVWAVAYAGNDLVLGGDFTKIRPPGTAAGSSQERPAPHLAAFNKFTGEPDPSFDPRRVGANGSVLSLVTSGSRLYVGGAFTRLLGQPRQKAAAIDIGSWTLNPAWQPKFGDHPRAMAVAGDGTVYVGGTFGSVNGKARRYLAAVSPSGALLNWRAGRTLDGTVRSILVAPGGRVVIGGYFFKVDGVSQQYIASLAGDPNGPGSVARWPAYQNFHDCLRSTYVAALETDGVSVFAGVGGYRKVPGTNTQCREGLFSINPATGAIRWYRNADGDVQAIARIGSKLYVSGHFLTAFGQPRYHLAAISTGGVLDNAWTPKMNGAKGGWSAATDGTRVAFGGDFSKINVRPQAGIVQFSG